MSDQAPVAFFDVTSLGSLRRSLTGDAPLRLAPYPGVRAPLEALRADGIRLVASASPGLSTPEQLIELLERDGLGELLAVEVTLVRDAGPAGFASMLQAVGAALEPSRCVFVCEDRDARSDALGEGLRVAPHPRLAAAALTGRSLRYVRASVPREHRGAGWRQAMLELELVPLHVAGEEGAVVYLIATADACARLDDLGFQVYRLGSPDEPLTTDVHVLRDDRQARTGFLVPEGFSSERLTDGEDAEHVLASTRRGLYVAIPARRSVESYHFEEARHGHTEKLLPDPSLLERYEELTARTWLAPAADRALESEERAALAEITPDRIAADLARYVGSEAIDDAGTRIRSRHTSSPDNAVAVATLARDLEATGLTVSAHSFLHEGRSLANVEAELPGADHDELVLVTAHLDSTAAFSAGFDPVRDPAPGADDDASGMVAVLAIARAFTALAQLRAPKRRIRFLLFNAEEHGLVGSRAYARDQAALGAPIIAVFQMDMIGYNREPPRSFEVHAGFLPSAEVQRRSLLLAERLARAVEQLSLDLPPPQIYASDSAQQQQDPADGRSDHASFQLVGYAACVTSEDFFAGPAGDAARPEPNPSYHMSSDTFVDVDYAAELARAVAAAAWMTATT